MKRRSRKKPNTGGYTLMELVIVMAVITILVGIALPSLYAYSQHAKQIEMSDHQELVRKAISQYYAYEGHYPDVTGLDPDDGSQLLSQTQADQLRDLLRSVTTARMNTDDYSYMYNEATGNVTLAFK